MDEILCLSKDLFKMNSIKIAFLGDIMSGGVLHRNNDDFISDEVLNYLFSFDFRVANFECAVGDNLEYDEEKMQGKKNIIYSKEVDFDKLLIMGINVVSIANNHICDLGENGLNNTIRLLKENGIKYCGAGKNIDEASEPAVISINSKNIAFLAFTYRGVASHVATHNQAGVNPLDEKKIIRDIKEAKQKFDYVFVIPHWGKEYTHFPTNECKRLAYCMIHAGADGIVGSHSHQIQPLVRYRRKPIFFSLGNFLFPDFYMHPPRPMWYPNENEINENIPICYEYPYPITTPVLRVWKDISRIGMIASFTIANTIKTEYKLSVLTKDNKVIFLKKNRKYKRRLSLISFIIKLKLYKWIWRFYCKIQRLIAIK